MDIDTPAGRLSKINVIVSDNDDQIVRLMTNILKKLGFGGIFPAYDGFEAVNVLKKKKVHLIITDWELAPMGINENKPADGQSEVWDVNPPENGASFVKFIRGSKVSPAPFIPIIMLTGLALQHNIEYARDSGVDDILVKPVSGVDLCRRIVKIVNHPRFFISSKNYKGPCRRRRDVPLGEQAERRKSVAKEIKRTVL